MVLNVEKNLKRKTLKPYSSNLKSILCENKSKLIPNSYPDIYTLNFSCNAEYIGETMKKVITRTIEHEQDSLKGKWESSGATEQCLKCHGQFNLLHPKTLSREARYKSRKIRESLEIKIFFFLSGFFFQEHSQFTGQQGKGEVIYLTPAYHFHLLHRHLDIYRAITAESSPLHIAGNRTRTGNLWFPGASR